MQMTENERFKWQDVYKWGVPAFLEVMNGLDKKNQQLKQENEQLKKYNKGQELEITRLHNLADAMSAVLRELGIYDVYNDEQIENVKRRIMND